MAVFRIEKNKNYTVMANYHLRDISLSLKAKGLRHVEGVTESELADPMTIDEEAFRLIMNALLIAKYGTAAFHRKGDISHEP